MKSWYQMLVEEFKQVFPEEQLSYAGSDVPGFKTGQPIFKIQTAHPYMRLRTISLCPFDEVRERIKQKNADEQLEQILKREAEQHGASLQELVRDGSSLFVWFRCERGLRRIELLATARRHHWSSRCKFDTSISAIAADLCSTIIEAKLVPTIA